MVVIVRNIVTSEELFQAQQDIKNYMKFVVDIEKEIVALGGARHVDAEQLLLQQGSSQSALWGGGIDIQYGEIDFDSMINLRPRDSNPSKDVLSMEIREKIKSILSKTAIWTAKN